MAGKLLTTEQLAEALNVNPEQIRRFVLDGELHPIDVRRRGSKRQCLRFDDEDVTAFKERRKRRNGCQPSIKTKTRRSSAPTSGSMDRSFLARLERRAAEKLKPKLVTSNK